MQMSVATLCLTKKKSSTLSEIERLVAGKKGQSGRRLMDDGISCSHFRGRSATVMPSSRNEILSEKYHRTESLMTKRKEKKRKFSSDEEKSSIHANLWIRPEKIWNCVYFRRFISIFIFVTWATLEGKIRNEWQSVSEIFVICGFLCVLAIGAHCACTYHHQ